MPTKPHCPTECMYKPVPTVECYLYLMSVAAAVGASSSMVIAVSMIGILILNLFHLYFSAWCIVWAWMSRQMLGDTL